MTAPIVWDDVHVPVAPTVDLPPFIRLLEERSLVAGLSAARFAAHLRIDQGMWSRVRRNLERFGPDTCSRIVAVYPDLRNEAAHYLTDRFPPGAYRLLEEAGRLVRTASHERSAAGSP